MKKTNFLTAGILFLLITPCTVTGQLPEIEDGIWSSGTAFPVQAGRLEFGIFMPAAYGLSESLELTTHLLPNIYMPNAGLKWSHGSVGPYQWATRHSIYYPTPLLNLVAKEGIGGLISPEFTIPDMLAVHNEMMLTRAWDPHLLTTLKLGVTVAFGSGDLDPRSTIDLPLVFPRLSVFYNTYSIRTGLNFQGRIFFRWHYHMATDLFFLPGAEEGFAFEQTAFLLWRKNPRFQSGFGCKLTYAEYPFGTQWHLIPVFDTQWALQIKK